MTPRLVLVGSICLGSSVSACGDGPPAAADDGGTGASETDASADGSDSGGETDTGGDPPPPDLGDGPANDEGSTGTGSGSGEETGQPPMETCETIPEPPSNIWIPEDGALVKVDAPTMTVVARYALPPGVSWPGQISVNLHGDVAVALGDVGAMMIHADPADCPDPNATSRGPDDLRPFPDGCVGWTATVGTMTTATWSAGWFDEQSCRWEGADLWAIDERGAIRALLLDGETGHVRQTVDLPLAGGLTGRRQIAVDAEGSLWATSELELFRISEDLDVRIWPAEVPREGRVVVADAGRIVLCGGRAVAFDPAPESWYSFEGLLGDCTMDLLGAAFGSEQVGHTIVRLDTAGVQIGGLLASLPVYSLDLDHERFVWALGAGDGAQIHRIDLTDASLTPLTGIDAPAAAVGDLTGVALWRVAPPG